MNKSNVLRVATFNIRFDFNNGAIAPSIAKTVNTAGERPWHIRRRRVADTILFHRVDIVGLQEVLKNQISDLEALLGQDWHWVGVGRDDGKVAGEFVPIFYNKNRVELLESKYYWLSETPDVPGSKGWDADLPRVVTQIRFLDLITGKKFWFINTHFDHGGSLAREESAKLILRQSQDLFKSPDPVFLTGDFNCQENEEPYKLLTGKKYANNNDNTNLASLSFADTRYEISNKSIETSYGFSNTFTGFSSSVEPIRIDFILVNNNNLETQIVKVLNHGTIPNLYDDNLYISDHRPVIADLIF
ncbi:Endonuclease/exonuclease/phosphatase [Gigaspora margarita]|uniref:Endonuclease/exonuclease/phosphatase n=1 Tax=Gigaspora margarita TaxID=4874 RepID=A0A8H4AQI7_GIGMA|nr:Endonuclease/exonuclease/phosphatase [Gigaspora margarita]